MHRWPGLSLTYPIADGGDWSGAGFEAIVDRAEASSPMPPGDFADAPD